MANDSLQIRIEGIDSLSGTLKKIQTSLQTLNQSLEGLSRSFSGVAQSSAYADQRLGSVGNQLLENTAQARVNASATDSAGDQQTELGSKAMLAAAGLMVATSSMQANAGAATANAASVKTLSEAMEDLDFSVGSLSVNVGAFTIALRDMATQVPILLTSFGSLISVLGGLATAATVAGGAMTGLFGGGMIALAEEYAETMEDVEGTAEGMQEVMSRVGDLFREAIEPLVNAGNIDVFISTVEGIANILGALSQVVSDMRGDVLDLFSRIQEQADSATSIIDAFTAAFYELEPFLEKVAVAMVNSIIPAIEYFVDITTKIESELTEFISALTDAISSFVRFGSTILSGILPVITVLLEEIAAIIEVINSLDQETLALVGTLMGLVGVLKVLSGLTGKASAGFVILGGSIQKIFFADEIDTVKDSLVAFKDEATSVGDELFEGFMNAAERMPTFNEARQSVYKLGGAFKSTAGTAGGSMKAIASSAKSMGSTIFTTFAASIAHITGLSSVIWEMTDGSQDAMELFEMSLFPTFSQLGQYTNDAKGSIRSFGQTLKNTRPAQFGKGLLSGIDEMNGAYRRLDGQAATVTQALTQHWNNGAAGMGAAINTMLTSTTGLIGGLQNLGRASLTAAKNALIHVKAEFLSVSALKGKAVAAYAAAKGLIVQAAATIKAAAAAVLLNTTLAGLPLLIGAIATAGAAVVGILGNLGGPTKAWGKTVNFAKSALNTLVDVLLSTFIPIWNLLVDIFAAVYSPIMGIVDGFVEIGRALGLVSEDGEGAGGILSSISSILMTLLGYGGQILSVLGGAFQYVGKILNSVFYTVLISIAEIIRVLIGLVSSLVNWFLSLETVQRILSGIGSMVSALKGMFTGFIETIKGMPQIVAGIIEGIVNGAIDIINGFIKKANNIPGLNIDTIDSDFQLLADTHRDAEGLKVARDDFESESEDEGDKDDMPQAASPDLTFNENNETHMHGDFNMAPEEEERIKRLVDDALKEANEFRRRREGHTG